jgi:uncharacterized membrane protein YjgN (DUF898 family)
MNLLLTIAALCGINGGSRVPYVEEAQMKCQQYFINCYESKMIKHKEFLYKKEPDSGGILYLSQCIKERK